jgi:putative endonuclease
VEVYYTYMIKSVSTARHYYGHTRELEERLHEHNSDQSPYTKGKGPWELVGYKPFSSKAEASRCELRLKRMKNPSRAYYWLTRNGVVS